MGYDETGSVNAPVISSSAAPPSRKWVCFKWKLVEYKEQSGSVRQKHCWPESPRLSAPTRLSFCESTSPIRVAGRGYGLLRRSGPDANPESRGGSLQPRPDAADRFQRRIFGAREDPEARDRYIVPAEAGPNALAVYFARREALPFGR